LYEGFNVALPFVTQTPLYAAAVVRSYGWLLLLAVVAIIAVLGYLRQKFNWLHVHRWDDVALIGTSQRLSAYVQLARCVATLIESGSSTREALFWSLTTIPQHGVRRAITKFLQNGMAQPGADFARSRQLPATFVYALLDANGSSSGRAELLRSMANLYERRLRRRELVVGGVWEFASIVLLALFVAIVAVGVFAPLVSLISSLSG
ncbi:MAG: type II secretion system F family protein, partial [Planctomycetales bacterium]|nr:type II secretion system F family protein [Planctomycetales bacterium]